MQVAGAITSLQPAATIVDEMMRQAVQVMLPSYHPYRLVDEMMHQAVQVMRTNAGMLE